MSTSKLPDTLSGLIRVALADLRKVEARADIYRIDMSEWHTGTRTLDRSPRKCAVCLAGAVMAFSLDAPYSEFRTPSYYVEGADGENIMNKLSAINDLRDGCVVNAHDVLTGGLIPPDEDILDIDKQFICMVPPYEEDPEEFHSQMEELAAALEAVGK